jgi:hypothetical protein
VAAWRSSSRPEASCRRWPSNPPSCSAGPPRPAPCCRGRGRPAHHHGRASQPEHAGQPRRVPPRHRGRRVVRDRQAHRRPCRRRATANPAVPALDAAVPLVARTTALPGPPSGQLVASTRADLPARQAWRWFGHHPAPPPRGGSPPSTCSASGTTSGTREATLTATESPCRMRARPRHERLRVRPRPASGERSPPHDTPWALCVRHCTWVTQHPAEGPSERRPVASQLLQRISSVDTVTQPSIVTEDAGGPADR